MGVDLYGVVQKRHEGRWVDLQKIECPGSYDLIGWFGLSESDRNYTYELTRLSPPRGLPDDYVEGPSCVDGGYLLGDWGYSNVIKLSPTALVLH